MKSATPYAVGYEILYRVKTTKVEHISNLSLTGVMCDQELRLFQKKGAVITSYGANQKGLALEALFRGGRGKSHAEF